MSDLDLFDWTPPPPPPPVTSDGVRYDRLDHGETWEERFNKFDAANPHIYQLFERYALQLVRAGRDRFSARTVVERIRWDALTSTNGSAFKFNENFTAYYGRKFMRLHPECEGMIETRRLRSQEGA